LRFLHFDLYSYPHSCKLRSIGDNNKVMGKTPHENSQFADSESKHPVSWSMSSSLEADEWFAVDRKSSIIIDENLKPIAGVRSQDSDI
jgi:hypothetical protein